MNKNTKIGSLIPIRLASERLPLKAIMKVKNKPLVCHLIDRVYASKHIQHKKDIIICTTKDKSDDKLVKIVKGYGASIFRGDRDDIIKRFNDAISHFDLDYIIQVDGDDIFCATEYMDKTMDTLLEDPKNLDIVTVKGLPLGISSKSFTRKAMERVFDYYRTTQNDTGFIYYFTKTGLCNERIIEPLSKLHILDEARLTLDYKVDLEVFTKIINALYHEDRTFDLKEIVQFLKKNPDVMKINSNLEKEYWERTKEKAQLVYKDSHGKSKQILIN